MLIHVLGSKGWIGSSIIKYFINLGYEVNQVHRNNIHNWLKDEEPKDLVIYVIGITGNYRTKPYETYESHVGLVAKILKVQGKLIKKFLYFSSSRVYINNPSTNEDDSIKCIPKNPSDLYNISKLMGESLVLSNKNQNYKVVRVSNVVGENQPKETFIGQLISECQNKGLARIIQSPLSEKDYIAMDDLVYFIHQISVKGKYRIYNVASGSNTSHEKVAEILNSKGYNIKFVSNNLETFISKPINISRLMEDYKKPKDPFRNLK